MEDRIEKVLELKAPVSRVWSAITDYKEFGEWFGVSLSTPFVEGRATTGQMTIGGCENLEFRVTVEKIEPQSLFSYSWHPGGGDPEVDYSQEPTTLVEFRLEPVAGGTRLMIVESGFSAFTDHQRGEDALRNNTTGWDFQSKKHHRACRRLNRVHRQPPCSLH